MMLYDSSIPYTNALVPVVASMEENSRFLSRGSFASIQYTGARHRALWPSHVSPSPVSSSLCSQRPLFPPEDGGGGTEAPSQQLSLSALTTLCARHPFVDSCLLPGTGKADGAIHIPSDAAQGPFFPDEDEEKGGKRHTPWPGVFSVSGAGGRALLLSAGACGPLFPDKDDEDEDRRETTASLASSSGETQRGARQCARHGPLCPEDDPVGGGSQWPRRQGMLACDDDPQVITD